MNINKIVMPLLFILISCGHNYEYSIQILNSTSYHLYGIDFNWCYSTDIPRINLDSGNITPVFSISKTTSGVNLAGYVSVCFDIDSAKLGNKALINQNEAGYSVWNTDLAEGKVNLVEIYELSDISSFKYRITTK